MKPLVYIITILLLLLNSLSALYGGYYLIIYPDGSKMELPLQLLKDTQFENFLIPGIILLTCNGLFGIITLLFQVFKLSNYPLLVIAQGCILTGWIIIQYLLIKTFFLLQPGFGLLGIVLIVFGALQIKSSGRKALGNKL